MIGRYDGWLMLGVYLLAQGHWATACVCVVIAFAQ